MYFQDQDKYKNTTYYFKVCDKTTKAKAVKLCDEISEYAKEKSNHAHEFNNCFYNHEKNKFKVKDKWLDTTDFTKGVYYQGDLELCFYSMNRPDLSRSSRFSIMSCYIETEGYYAKLKNVKQIEIDD